MDERVYTGREILDMYKKDYDNTVYTQVNDNGIHYMLGRLAGPGGIGWEPFKAAFRELTTTGRHPRANTTSSNTCFRSFPSTLPG